MDVNSGYSPTAPGLSEGENETVGVQNEVTDANHDIIEAENSDTRIEANVYQALVFEKNEMQKERDELYRHIHGENGYMAQIQQLHLQNANPGSWAGNLVVELTKARAELGSERQSIRILQRQNENLRASANVLEARIIGLQVQIMISGKPVYHEIHDCGRWSGKIHDHAKAFPTLLGDFGNTVQPRSSESSAQIQWQQLLAWYTSLTELVQNPSSSRASFTQHSSPVGLESRCERKEHTEEDTEEGQNERGSEPVQGLQTHSSIAEDPEKDDCPKQLAQARKERDEAVKEAKQLRDLMVAKINAEGAQARVTETQNSELNDCRENLVQVEEERDEALKEVRRLRQEVDNDLKDLGGAYQVFNDCPERLAHATKEREQALEEAINLRQALGDAIRDREASKEAQNRQKDERERLRRLAESTESECIMQLQEAQAARDTAFGNAEYLQMSCQSLTRREAHALGERDDAVQERESYRNELIRAEQNRDREANASRVLRADLESASAEIIGLKQELNNSIDFDHIETLRRNVDLTRDYENILDILIGRGNHTSEQVELLERLGVRTNYFQDLREVQRQRHEARVARAAAEEDANNAVANEEMFQSRFLLFGSVKSLFMDDLLHSSPRDNSSPS